MQREHSMAAPEDEIVARAAMMTELSEPQASPEHAFDCDIACSYRI